MPGKLDAPPPRRGRVLESSSRRRLARRDRHFLQQPVLEVGLVRLVAIRQEADERVAPGPQIERRDLRLAAVEHGRAGPVLEIDRMWRSVRVELLPDLLDRRIPL